MSELSVLTYNMHKGFSGDGRRTFVLPRMREALASSAADVVFLQEAQGEHQRHAERVIEWPGASQFEFIADNVWNHAVYGQNARYDHGHHGNAILSKYPLFDSQNIDVSPYPFAASRSLLHACIEMPRSTTRVHLVCIHVGFIGIDRRPQIHRLCEHIEARIPHHEALIVAGDFNDWWGRAEREFNSALGLREVFHELHGRRARSFPSWAPLFPMDRIYCRGMEPRVATRLGGAPWRTLSDHAPLLAWFTL